MSKAGHPNYFKEILWEAWEETSVLEIICEVIVGATVPLIAFHESLAKRDEIAELIFLEVVAAIMCPILVFIIRAIFVAPYKIHKKQIEKHQEETGKLQSRLEYFTGIKPLGIEALLPKKLADHPYSVYACDICIKNDNQAVSGVKLKLVEINPPFQTMDSTIARQPLSNIKFFDTDPLTSTLNPGEKAIARIFIIERQPYAVSVQFGARWEFGDKQFFFTPKTKTTDTDYILTFEASASGIPVNTTTFRMRFLLDANIVPFEIQKVD